MTVGWHERIPGRAVAALALATFGAAGSTPALAANPDAIAVIVGNKNMAVTRPWFEFAHNDAEAMKRFVVGAFGYRERNVIDLRDATKGPSRSGWRSVLSSARRIEVSPAASALHLLSPGRGGAVIAPKWYRCLSIA